MSLILILMSVTIFLSMCIYTGIEVLAVGSLLGGGLSMLGSKKQKDFEPPTPPALPEAPKPPTETQADYNKAKANDAERRRNLMRQGRSSTILTGALGDTSTASTNKKTLLGS